MAVEGSLTVILTPRSFSSRGLAYELANGQIIVGELHQGRGNYEFDWEVKAVRKGYEDYRVLRPWNELLPADADPEEAWQDRARPEILAYVRDPRADRAAAAREALKPSGPQAEQGVRTELRDASGAVLLAYPDPAAGSAPAFPTLDRIDAAAQLWDPAGRKPWSLVVNRSSPSAYLRGHAQSIFPRGSRSTSRPRTGASASTSGASSTSSDTRDA